MRRASALCPLLGLLLAMTGPAAAGYLPDAYDLSRVLPPPPADDSPRTKQDLVAIHRWQVMRTATAVARAKKEAEDGIAAFRDPLGEAFAPETLPLTAALFADVQQGATAAVRRAQATYRRAAPATVDGGVKVCDGAFAAPSALQGVYPAREPNVLMVEALLLARMVPERADALVTRARGLAADRVMCGVHYPSDVEAGFMAASAMLVLLDANPAFGAALTAARAELRRALGLADVHFGDGHFGDGHLGDGPSGNGRARLAEMR